MDIFILLLIYSTQGKKVLCTHGRVFILSSQIFPHNLNVILSAALSFIKFKDIWMPCALHVLSLKGRPATQYNQKLTNKNCFLLFPSLQGQNKKSFLEGIGCLVIKLTDVKPDFFYTSDGLTNWHLLLGERCPGTRCQQTSTDGPRSESGDERTMVTSPPRSPTSPQTDLRENTPSPPSRSNNNSSNGPMWTEEAGLDNPAFEESTEEDGELTNC